MRPDEPQKKLTDSAQAAAPEGGALMSVAAALPLADIWGVRGGWWIVMCVLMMVCMAAMMFGMARMGTGAEHGRKAPWERFMTVETPEQILDRRFAEGAISLEDYERRKQQLAQHDPRQTEPSDAQPPSAVDAA